VRAQARQAGGDLLLAAISLTAITKSSARSAGRPDRTAMRLRRQRRDWRTGTSPILGRRSFPLVSTLNRALAANRMACRRS